MTTPYDSDRHPDRHGRSVLSRSFVPLALITLGVVFLLGNLIQRLAAGTDHARPGHRLCHWSSHHRPLRLRVRPASCSASAAMCPPGDRRGLPLQSSGWFFILLGLGFVRLPDRHAARRDLAALPGHRADRLGCCCLAGPRRRQLPRLPGSSLLAAALVLVGFWLLFRDHLPAAVRRPVATFGGIALLAYGLLAAVASVAAAGSFAAPTSASTSAWRRTPTRSRSISHRQWRHLQCEQLERPTTIRPAGRHRARGGHAPLFGEGQPPAVSLTPGAGGLHLDMPDDSGRSVRQHSRLRRSRCPRRAGQRGLPRAVRSRSRACQARCRPRPTPGDRP